MKLSPVLILLASLPLPAQAEIPEPVKVMLDAALSGGSDAEAGAVVKFARQAHPQHAAEIDALYAAHQSAREATRLDEIRSAGLFDIWSGRGEIGASRSTGTSNTLGIFASAGLAREGLSWRHALRGEADIQRSGGVTTKERFLAAYEPNYKVNDRLFAYGLVQAERDTTLGYDVRASASGGLGIAAVKQPDSELNLQGGPAFRLTSFIDGETESQVAARAAMSARVALFPGMALTQNATAYLEPAGQTFTASTGLETRLIGALTARLSHNLQYESTRPPGQEPLDTLSRFTLVYGF